MRVLIQKTVIIMFASMALFTAGCGGGGGSAASGVSIGGAVYSGSTAPATISTTNATSVSSNVLGGASSTNVVTGAVVASKMGNMRTLPALAVSAVKEVAQSAPTAQGVAAGAVVAIGPVTVNGTGGGTAVMSGQIDSVTLQALALLRSSSPATPIMSVESAVRSP